MLIINADDFGASTSATDPIIAAYDEGLVSSATAMVWMPDSERAARLARERGMPLGLHLNFTLPFRDDRAPSRQRELQARLTSVFCSSSWHDDRPAPAENGSQIREAVGHQLDAFRAMYGEPTHVDGHHHVHVHPAVLVQLPTELPIRPVLRAPAEIGRRPTPRDRLLRKLFRSPEVCLAFPQIHPALGGAGLELLDLSREQTVEVMTHPQLEPEQHALRSREWIEAVARLQCGSYRDLPAR